MLLIYVLELDENKYYIGKTTNPNFRLETHFDIGESVWTTKYKPIKLIELIAGCDNFDEDKYTLKYMEKYGIDNVRGGSFCEIRLSEENTNTINKMITSSIKPNNDENKYNEYMNKYNNLEEINVQIKELDIQFEYVKDLNHILSGVNSSWKQYFNFLNDIIKKSNFNNEILKYKGKIKNLMANVFNNSGVNSLNLFDDKNDNEIYDIYSNLTLIVDDINTNNKQLSKNIIDDINKNSYEVSNIIFDNYFNRMSCYCSNTFYGKNNYISNTKSKFMEHIVNTYIDFDIFDKFGKYDCNVRINKILLFKLQLEKELERIYKIHQVKKFSMYELEVNKKMELLTSRMIELTIQI